MHGLMTSHVAVKDHVTPWGVWLNFRAKLLIKFARNDSEKMIANLLPLNRPIALESVPLKIVTSCIRDLLFTFVSGNKYVDNKFGKDFLPELTVTFQRTAHMTNIISIVRIKQKSTVITLHDLKNAFGEVHQNLVSEVLNYHHIPTHIQCLI